MEASVQREVHVLTRAPCIASGWRFSAGNAAYVSRSRCATSLTRGPDDANRVIDRTGSAPTAVSGEESAIDAASLNLTAAPVIGVSPARISLLIYAFRSLQPPGKTLTITNLGGGKVTRTARDNAYWLKFRPTSGTAPSTVAVWADRAAIPIGINGYRPRYLQASIIVSAAGASNTPLTVPVWLTISYER